MARLVQVSQFGLECARVCQGGPKFSLKKSIGFSLIFPCPNWLTLAQPGHKNLQESMTILMSLGLQSCHTFLHIFMVTERCQRKPMHFLSFPNRNLKFSLNTSIGCSLIFTGPNWLTLASPNHEHMQESMTILMSK